MLPENAWRAAERGDAIRGSWSDTFPEERRPLDRSPSDPVPHMPPAGSFRRGMAHVRFRPSFWTFVTLDP
jgi:hypothetical protein